MKHLAEDNWAAAIQLDEDFDAHADRACKAPALYRSGRMKEKREIVVHPNSVMVYQAACGDAFEGADRAAGIETVVTSLIGPTGDNGVGAFAGEGSSRALSSPTRRLVPFEADAAGEPASDRSVARPLEGVRSRR